MNTQRRCRCESDHKEKETRVIEIARKFSCSHYYWLSGPIVKTEQGTLVWCLHSAVGIEMTIDRSFRITDWANNLVIALSIPKQACLVHHSNGTVFVRDDGIIEVRAYDLRNKNDKFSKMNMKTKVMVFSSRESKLPFTLTEGGVASKRISNTKFSPMYGDFSHEFLAEISKIGPDFKKRAEQIIKEFDYDLTPRSQIWSREGMRISFSFDGKLMIKTAEMSLSVWQSKHQTQISFGSKLYIGCRGGNEPYLYMKNRQFRVYYDGIDYINRNAGQSAGFDRFGTLKIYNARQV